MVVGVVGGVVEVVVGVGVVVVVVVKLVHVNSF